MARAGWEGGRLGHDAHISCHPARDSWGAPAYYPAPRERSLLQGRSRHSCFMIVNQWLQSEPAPHKLHNCNPLPSDVLGLSFNKAFGVSVHLNQQFSIHDHANTWKALKNSYQCYRCISVLSRTIPLLGFCILPFNRPIEVNYSGS